MEQIAELLFENKEQIPDGLYMRLMNTLKIQQNKDSYYKLKILTIPCSAGKSSAFDIATTSLPERSIISEIVMPFFQIQQQCLEAKVTASPFIPFVIHNYEIPNDTPTVTPIELEADFPTIEVACYNVYVVIGVTKI